MNCTDYLHLNKLKIFENVRNLLPKRLTNSANILTIHDGVLFTWDFENSCVLTLNLKAARTEQNDSVSHQNLLPLIPVLFEPEFLIANELGTLLIVAGKSGILVLELPLRYPPYGAFEKNKDLVYCRSHSLDERLLCCSEFVRVRQVRFHPGSPKSNHILALTSDNRLRLYVIQNSSAISLATFQIGETVSAFFPGTKTLFSEIYGEAGVDFDFGQPELDIDIKSTPIEEQDLTNLIWPVYILTGDGRVYSIYVPIEPKKQMIRLGPLVTNVADRQLGEGGCSLMSLNTTPEIICIANSQGTIYHCLVLPMEDDIYKKLKWKNANASKKELICFESIELELGLSTTTDDDDRAYTCPIFLHKDSSKSARYYATHTAGLHSVNITCVKDLQHFVNNNNEDDKIKMDDIFMQESKAEYLICTKTANSEKSNSIIGFTLYYEPTSIIALLANGNLVSLGILTAEVLNKIEEIQMSDFKTDEQSPMKTLLREPFHHFIQKLLKKTSNQPILQLGGDGKFSQKECYELLQRTSQVFKDYFENHTRAKEELEKRVKALRLMKEFQLAQTDKMNAEKHQLREKAESLAEKYEDLKEKQDEIMRRCERLLVLVSQKKAEPSDAEKVYLDELEKYVEKMKIYKTSIGKLQLKVNYQKMQIANWKAHEVKKTGSGISDVHSPTIKNNLEETSEKIQVMIKEINEIKDRLNLK